MVGWSRIRAATATAGALLFGGFGNAGAQVVAEPAMLTAGVPSGETFAAYLAFPDNSFVIGGMIRIPVARDVDIGGRAGLWLLDGGEDKPYAGADLRYGLFSRPLSPEGGAQLSFTFDVGLGVGDPGPTVWKLPVGFIAGVGFGMRGGDAEIFAHPRLELGLAGGGDSDVELLFDLGGLFPITPIFGVMPVLRFGDGVFGEGDQIVFGLAGVWRL